MSAPIPTLQGRFDIGGRSLYAEVYGTGSPTIIIETGSTMPGTSDPGWYSFRDLLAQETRVFLYDRANLGQSDPAPLPRTLDDFTADLRAVLQAAQIAPPYLLVGCSLGGMLVTHYASRYPEEIHGILLLDPPHPEVHVLTLALLPLPDQDEPRSLTEFRKLVWTEQFLPLEAPNLEGLDFLASADQARPIWNLRDIPLYVLTAGVDEWEDGFPPDVAAAYENLWLTLQEEYAALSTQSTHMIVEDSGHVIHDQRPDLVMDVLQKLLKR